MRWKRNLPFYIQVGEDSAAGATESHEVDTDAYNPLLISLFAQAKLSLIKDVAQCRCHIGVRSPNGSMFSHWTFIDMFKPVFSEGVITPGS